MNAREFLNRGNAHHALGNYNLAIADHTQAFDLYTSNAGKANARYNRGKAHRLLGKYDLAIADHTQAFDLYTSNVDKADTRLERGLAHYLLGKYDLAIVDYTHAFDLYTSNADKANARLNRGNAHQLLGKYDLAIADHTQALDLYTSNADKANARFNRGNVHRLLGKYDLAIEDLTQAFDLYTSNVDKAYTRLKRGNAHHELGKYDLAIVDYTQAFDLYTSNANKANARLSCGLAHLEQKNNEAAKRDFSDSWRTLEDTQPLFKIYSGMQLKKLNATSNNDNEEKIELNPLIDQLALKPGKTPDALCILSIVSTYVGRYDIAKENCKAFFKQFSPNQIPFYLRKEFFEVLIDKKLNLTEAFSKKDFKDIKEAKKQLLGLIIALRDDSQKQNALCQTLIAKTFLGSIFNVKQLIGTPSLSSSKNKKMIATYLENEVKTHGLKLNETTIQALREEEQSFQTSLQKMCPSLANMSTKVQEQKSLPSPTIPASNPLTFFSPREGTYVCTTIATPDGNQPNPAYKPGMKTFTF